MKKQLVNFETAKLAKEKGFDWKPDFYSSGDYYTKHGGFIKESLTLTYDKRMNDFYLAPTQSLLRKWLRDKYKIHIIINYLELSEKWTAEPIFYLEEELSLNNTMGSVEGETYEEVLEKAIQKALNNIDYE